MKSSTLVLLVERARKKTVALVLLGNLIVIAYTIIDGYPNSWVEFEREKNFWVFANSVEMVLVACIAYVNYLLLSGMRHVSASVSFSRRLECAENDTPARLVVRKAWVWALVALAFLFFACDDRFMFHEHGGHAIEDAIPVLSRSNIVLFMDDMIELLYVCMGGVFGVVFLRREMTGRNSFRLYMYGVLSVFVATLIGLHPAVKAIPFPLAVLQNLHLLCVYLMFISFINCTAAEILLAASPVQVLRRPDGSSSEKDFSDVATMES
ncbi:MAG: hypothetical protein HYX78_04170 [Armatimonadetes bacterium]|nr:hypothetical protein [Armatimonadota bacterium]